MFKTKIFIITGFFFLASILPVYVLAQAQAPAPTTSEPEKLQLKNISKEKNEEGEASVFTPADNSFRFKVDPKEINNLNSSDIQNLNEKINLIKAKILDTKTRIRETNTGGKERVNISIARIVINHKNNMSNRFKLMNLTYILDGKKVYSNYDLEKQEEKFIHIYDAIAAPGNHELIVQAVYTGNTEGVFDYLNDYRIKVRKRYTFVVKDGTTVTMEGQGYEKGRFFTSFRERPQLDITSTESAYSMNDTFNGTEKKK